MKNLIRKWIGIREPAAPANPISDAEIRKLIAKALLDALANKQDYEGVWGVSIYHMKNSLNEAISAAVSETATEAAQLQINQRIGKEAFIDEVVARIKRKQVL